MRAFFCGVAGNSHIALLRPDLLQEAPRAFVLRAVEEVVRFALLDGYLEQSEAVELKKWEQRRRLQRFIERCARLVSPLL